MLYNAICHKIRFSIGIRSLSSFKVLEKTPIPKDSDEAKRGMEAEKLFCQMEEFCSLGGGSKGIHLHTIKNKKLLVRERIRHLIDPQSEILELSKTAGMRMDYGDVPCGGTVTAIGFIHGIPIMIIANDGTVKGGTSYPISVTKSLRAQEIALENKLPICYIVDSGGAYLPLQSDIFPDEKHGGRTFRNQVVLSSLGIPQIACVAGNCTAGGAYTPTMCEQTVMVSGIGSIYLGGPPLVKAATGEVVSNEDLGGAKLHSSVSGVSDYFAATELEAFEIIRECIETLNWPSSIQKINLKELSSSSSDLNYYDGLDRPMVRKEMFQILAQLLDEARFHEFKPLFGNGLICGWGRLNGVMTGILANVGLPLSVSDAQKGTHFIQCCEARKISCLFLQNGSREFKFTSGETLRERAKLVSAIACSSIPKLSLTLKGLSGDENLTMCGPSMGPRFIFSWPRAQLSKSDYGALQRISPKNEIPNSAQWAASHLLNDGIIIPKDTRKLLSQCLQLFEIDSLRNRESFTQPFFRM